MFLRAATLPLKRFIFLLCLINYLKLVRSQSTEEDFSETTTPITTTTQIVTENSPSSTEVSTDVEEAPPDTLSELEIIKINVVPALGNAVKLVWGRKIGDYNLNWTYGVYYGETQQELQEPRLTTSELYAVVKDLEFCTKYLFGVGVIENYGRIDPNSSYIRSIVTYADKSALPKNVELDFEPGEVPCMLIKWSASCSSVVEPIGYIITLLEKPTQKLQFLRIPDSRITDLTHSVAVRHGTIYEVKLATSESGFNTTDIVSYQTPYFLQPYKVKVTVNPDSTFMMFWKEPYVPYYVGEYYYEVYVYRGRNISEEFQSFKVYKPVYIHEGEDYVCTFSVGLASAKGGYRSFLTQPIVADKSGETRMLTVYGKDEEEEEEETS